MLDEKIKYGMQMSLMTDSEIYLLMGSNDYICCDFFQQIIEYYNEETPQLYGIDNYYNGKNIVCVNSYDGISNSFNICKEFLWDGVSSHFGRSRFNYCGGIIGTNKKFTSMYDILDIFQSDEGIIEEKILSKPNIDKFNSANIVFLNIKTPDNTELNTFDVLHYYLQNNTLDISTLPTYLHKKLSSILYDFLEL